MARTAEVLVVGAGIGGLTAALSLHAAGIGVTVVDSVRELRPLGVGINLQPAAVRELIELGIGDELAATAIPTAEHVYLDRFGNRIFAEPRGRERGYRWPQYSVHRGELQLLLLAAARRRLGPGAVHTGIRLTGIDQTASTVRARVLDRTTGATTTVESEALIGADGLHSTVRAQLHPEQGPLLWSGVRMWRGVTEAEPFLTGRSMVIAADDRGVEFLAYPISRRAADRGRAVVNWVCEVPMADPQPLAEDISWNRAGRLEDVLPHYADWDLGRLSVPGLIRHSGEILEYPMVDRDPLPAWGQGRITLLGDAAHPMYPVGANGASQAIVDARVLAYELATADDRGDGLAAYEKVRREATAAIVQANRDMYRAGRRAGRHEPARSDDIGAITDTYRSSTGNDVDTLNARGSLTPPQRLS